MHIFGIRHKKLIIVSYLRGVSSFQGYPNLNLYIIQVAFLADFGGPDLVASSYMDTEKPASVSPSHVVVKFTSVG